MYEGNQGEINFGSSYRESTIVIFQHFYSTKCIFPFNFDFTTRKLKVKAYTYWKVMKLSCPVTLITTIMTLHC